MKSFKFLLFATAAVLPAVPAWAQDQESGDATITVADPIDPHLITVTANGAIQRIDYTGRSVSVLDADDLARLQAVSLSDALAQVPGVSVTRNGGPGSFTGVRIRGAEAEQTLVLIDGVRVNDPSSPAGTFDFGNLLAGAVQRVDIQRGPNSVIWGSQAIGGVVDVQTMPASDYPSKSANASVEYGSFDSVSANAAVRLGGGDAFGLTLTGGYYSTDGISAAANGSEPDGYRQFGLSGRATVKLSENLSADVRGYFADSRTDLDGFPAPTYTLADTAEYSTAREVYGYAGLNLAAFDQNFTSRLSVSVADINRDNYDPAAGAAPVFFGRGGSERYEYRGDARLSGRVRLVFGAEHEDSRFTDGATPADTSITSGYAAAIVSPIDQITINAGVRHDGHRDFGGHTSFGLSGTVNPKAGLAFRASYSEGFKAPTLYQLHSFYGDPTLRPETAKSYEVGARAYVAPLGVRVDAAWFKRDTTNQINFDLGTFTYGNIDLTSTSGFEIEMTRRWGRLYLMAGYTHLVAENRSAGANFGMDLARRPRDFGSLSADYVWEEAGSIGVTVRGAGASYDDPGNFNRLPGYALVSLRGTVQLGERFELYGRVENLFDEQYQTVAGYGTPGRAAYVGLRMKLD